MTAVTVLLLAIIIHLLDTVSCRGEALQASMDGFITVYLCSRSAGVSIYPPSSPLSSSRVYFEKLISMSRWENRERTVYRGFSALLWERTRWMRCLYAQNPHKGWPLAWITATFNLTSTKVTHEISAFLSANIIVSHQTETLTAWISTHSLRSNRAPQLERTAMLTWTLSLLSICSMVFINTRNSWIGH
jgi:hypothetical protein